MHYYYLLNSVYNLFTPHYFEEYEGESIAPRIFEGGSQIKICNYIITVKFELSQGHSGTQQHPSTINRDVTWKYPDEPKTSININSHNLF